MLSNHNTLSRPISTFMYWACVGFTALIVLLLILVTGYLFYLGFSGINWAFFFQDPIPVGAEGSPGGMRNGIVGTAILIGLASTVGIPVGMLAGIFLAEYGANSMLSTPVRFVSDVLSGVPSIVVGILGYELLVVPLGHYNGWAGALGLAFIMIPIVARTTEEMLRLVPNSYREASIALGATKAWTILRVVIPSASGSLVTGVMLAAARAWRARRPLLFTALGSRFLTADPNQPFPSLTVQIFNNAMSPDHAQNRQAWAGILVLISMIFVLNMGIRYFARSRHAVA